MKLTSTSDDVLTGLVNPGLDTGVRLGETLETLNELGKIGSVLDLYGNLNDGGHGELHDLHVVSSLRGGEGTTLKQELIDTDETNNVTSRAILNRLDITTHHEHGTLNGLDKQVILLTGEVVGTLDTDLGASTDSTREDTTECVETTLIGSGDHLGDVENQRTLGITITDTDSGLVILRTLVKGFRTVPLGGTGGRKVEDNHL